VKRSALVVLAALAMAGTLVACESEEPRDDRAVEDDVSDLIGDPAQPYPYTTPVPPREPTALDGTYVRRLPTRGGTHIPCRRCAPYRLEGGPAELVIDEGRFFITHELAGFSSLGHVLVSESEVEFINDPNCPTTSGVYKWALVGGRLEFQVLDDDCPYSELRARYLTAAPWRAP
jgi:hypothetical protein